MARYYGRIGDQVRSIAYMDSTTVANQELFAFEQQRKDAQVATFRRATVASVISAGIIFIFLVIVLIFYRKKHEAYRKLAAQSNSP